MRLLIRHDTVHIVKALKVGENNEKLGRLTMDKNFKLKFAKILLRIGAVEVRPARPFTYASGLKGPIYCDNRKILAFPNERRMIRDGLKQLLEISGWHYDQLAGLATAGIPHAALLADFLEKPMVYIRSKVKGHGRGNQIEGIFRPGEKLVLVEDLINQGSSLDQALNGVANAELHAVGCLSIVTYQMSKAQAVSKKWSMPSLSLTDFDSLCVAAGEMGILSDKEIGLLRKWRDDPKSWSTQN